MDKIEKLNEYEPLDSRIETKVLDTIIGIKNKFGSDVVVDTNETIKNIIEINTVNDQLFGSVEELTKNILIGIENINLSIDIENYVCKKLRDFANLYGAEVQIDLISTINNMINTYINSNGFNQISNEQREELISNIINRTRGYCAETIISNGVVSETSMNVNSFINSMVDSSCNEVKKNM